MSTSQKKDKTDEKDKPEWVDALEKKLMDAIEGQSDVVMKRIADMEGKVQSQLDRVKLEVKKSLLKIGEIEQKMKKLEKEMSDNIKTLQKKVLLMDCKLLELHLRFRGIPDEQGILRDQIIRLIADFLQRSPDEIEKNPSDYAKAKNIPSDVVVQLPSKRIRD